MENIRKKLQEELTVAKWEILRPHFNNNALILVKPEADIIDVAIDIANDNVDNIKEMLINEHIVKIDGTIKEEWEKTDSNDIFHFLIVQPFVLIKRFNG